MNKMKRLLACVGTVSQRHDFARPTGSSSGQKRHGLKSEISAPNIISLLVLLILPFLGYAGIQPDAGMGEGGTVQQPDNAVIWYLGHCGFAVRTRNHLLIFDYQELRDGQQPKLRPSKPSLDNGWINPEEIKDLAVRVFVSHSHDDHFDRVVFEWKKTIPNIQYFFGWKAADDTAFHYLVGPRAEYKSGGLEIATINSHHSGVPEVAWLVKIDGVVIYHNGDCQPDDAVTEYEYLKSKTGRIDVAFVMPVHEEKLKYSIQNAELFRQFSPCLVFPMHVTAGAPMYTDFERIWTSRIPGLSVAIPKKMGERFEYENNDKGKMKEAK
jgi:L-ascorbate metabolism protein UlaG (beta-lactamase superfamily)